MKKYVNTKDGKEVKIGDIMSAKIDTSFGKMTVICSVDEVAIKEMLKLGIIAEMKDTITKEIPEACKNNNCDGINIEMCISSIAKRIGWKKENVFRYLDKLWDIDITAVYHILAKEVAIIIDKQYPDHINNSAEIWTIDLHNGRIIKVRDKIKNFKNFPAFRNTEDALRATKVLNPILDKMFSRNGK